MKLWLPRLCVSSSRAARRASAGNVRNYVISAVEFNAIRNASRAQADLVRRVPMEHGRAMT
eukprot:35298-Pyramimonas_sp.AAC.1